MLSDFELYVQSSDRSNVARAGSEPQPVSSRMRVNFGVDHNGDTILVPDSQDQLLAPSDNQLSDTLLPFEMFQTDQREYEDGECISSGGCFLIDV